MNADDLLDQLEPQFVAMLRSVGSSKEDGVPGFSEAHRAYLHTKHEIRLAFLHSSALLYPADEDSAKRRLLRKVLNRELLPFEAALVKGTELEEHAQQVFESDEPTDVLGDDALNHFFSWFDVGGYIDALLKFGPVVLRSRELPTEFESVFAAVRRCYGFGEYLAVVTLCRTAVEIALRDICAKEGFFDPAHDNWWITQDRMERKAQQRSHSSRRPDLSNRESQDYLAEAGDSRALLSRLPTYSRYVERERSLYATLSSYVHGRRVADATRAEEFARETVDLLHKLYEVHNDRGG